MAYCIYHQDLDGWASAAVIRFRHPRIKMIPIDYGDEFPLERLLQKDTRSAVFMVDFCPNDMSIVEQLIDNCTVFAWIDHHITSIEDFKKSGLENKLHDGCMISLDENHEHYAACELAYQWAFKAKYEDIPYYFKLLGRYDVWDHSDPNTLPFQYAMRTWIDDPKDDMAKWKKLIAGKNQNLFDSLLDKGHFVLEYEEQKNASKAKKASFELDFCGYKAIACNEIYTNSKFFNVSWNKDKHDLMLTFGFVEDRWRLSFYSPKEDVDVSQIAKSLGGGGHPGAAGATLYELPKELKEITNGN